MAGLTTLARLKAAHMPSSWYNNLTAQLGGEEQFPSNRMIFVSTIFDALGLEAALWSLRATNYSAEHVAREMAVKFARSIQHKMTDDRSFAAIDFAERMIAEKVTDEELDLARAAAYDAWRIANLETASAAWVACHAIGFSEQPDMLTSVGYVADAAIYAGLPKEDADAIFKSCLRFYPRRRLEVNQLVASSVKEQTPKTLAIVHEEIGQLEDTAEDILFMQEIIANSFADENILADTENEVAVPGFTLQPFSQERFSSIMLEEFAKVLEARKVKAKHNEFDLDLWECGFNSGIQEAIDTITNHLKPKE